MPPTSFISHIPLELDCPPPMAAAMRYVLEGEYENHFDGAGLDILDIGANTGSFARWPDMCWPNGSVPP
jgi:hypothetical protein